MKSKLSKLIPRLAGILLLFLFACQGTVHAASIGIQGSPIDDDYITRNDMVYIPLDSIASHLGLSILNDGNRLLVGGTIHGALVFEPESNALTINGQTSDMNHRLVNESGRWYVPGGFLRDFIGLQAVLNESGDNLQLYPLITEITASSGKVDIISSTPNVFTTVEYTDPARRVIDIRNAYLSGGYTQISGMEIGLESVRELRASQFSVDPPTVRVVLEWEDASPPAHTIFPDGKTISVMIGHRIAGGTTPLTGNIIMQAVDTGDEIQEETIDDVTDVTDVTVTSSDLQYPGTTQLDEGENHLSIFSIGYVESDFQLPAPNIQNNVTENLGPEISGSQSPTPPTPPSLPDGAENMSLTELGWDVSLAMNSDGDISATIQTPPYDSISDFVLPGDNPRLVLDLTGTCLPGSERTIGGLGSVDSIRFAQFEPEISRIVLDLDHQTGYRLEKNPSEGIINIDFTSGDLTGMTIVIDAGHGGEDPGAVQNGLWEKDLNLEMSLYLRELLTARGATVLMTRETDVYVTLKDRVDLAINNDADLFICVHNNSSEEETTAQGLWLIYNNEDNMGLYNMVHRGVLAQTGVPGRGPIEDERGLYILRHLREMPVLYVEAAFLTNPNDVVRLADESRSYVRNIMDGVTDGILAHYAGYQLPEINIPGFDSSSFALADSGTSGSVNTASWETPQEISDGDISQPGEVSDTSTDENDNDVSDNESDDDDSDDEVDDEDDEEENENHRRRGRGGYRYRD